MTAQELRSCSSSRESFPGVFRGGSRPRLSSRSTQAKNRDCWAPPILPQRLHSARASRVTAAMTNDIVGNVVAEDGKIDSTSVRDLRCRSRTCSGAASSALRLGTRQPLPDPASPSTRCSGSIGSAAPAIMYLSSQAALALRLRFTERLENYKRQHLPTDDSRARELWLCGTGGPPQCGHHRLGGVWSRRSRTPWWRDVKPPRRAAGHGRSRGSP